MKILFITPLSNYSHERWTPLGICYISSLLKEKGHSVRVYDRFLKAYIIGDKKTLDRDMRSEILSFSPDIIGFSTVSPMIYDIVECVKYIRDFFDGIIIAGGHHATAIPEITLKKIPGLDYIAAGEAEYTLLSLADGNDASSIPGIFSQNNDSSSFSHSQIKDLDKLPFPDYSVFDMDYYTQANRHTIRGFYLRTACILSSRGCANNCKFCTESLNYGKGIRFHSPDYIIENIERLLKDYKVRGIYFHDNNFLSSRSHAENICEKIIRQGLHKKIKWAVQGSTSEVDSDILCLLREANCVKIEFGIESIKDSDLRNMSKNATVDINEKALSLCRQNGIKAHAYFMIGFKGESITDLYNTLEWIKRFKPHTFSFSPIKIYPGTALYKSKGDSFFENSIWNRKNIEKYFINNKFDSIKKDEKYKWYSEVFRPFSIKYHRKSLFESNSIPALIKMAYKKYF